MNLPDRVLAEIEERECDYDSDTMVLRDTHDFLEAVFEIAFGDDAVNKEFSDYEVLAKLREFSDNSL